MKTFDYQSANSEQIAEHVADNYVTKGEEISCKAVSEITGIEISQIWVAINSIQQKERIDGLKSCFRREGASVIIGLFGFIKLSAKIAIPENIKFGIVRAFGIRHDIRLLKSISNAKNIITQEEKNCA